MPKCKSSMCTDTKCIAICSSTNKRCRNPIKEDGLCNIHFKKMKIEPKIQSEEYDSDDSVEDRVDQEDGGDREDRDDREDIEEDTDSDDISIRRDNEDSDNESDRRLQKINKEIREMKKTHHREMMSLAKSIDNITNKIASIKIDDVKNKNKKRQYTQTTLLNRAKMEHYHQLKNNEGMLSTIHEFYKIVGIEKVNKHLIKVYLDNMFDKYDESNKLYFIEIAKIYLTKE